MRELIGDFGKFGLLNDGARVLEIPTEVTMQLFKSTAVKKTDIIANELGLYSFLNVGRHGKAKMMQLGVPKHLLQARKNCLTWTPKGKAGATIEEIKTEPVEYMGEQCPDFLMGECLEYVLGTGNDVRDINGTPESRALFSQALDNVFLALGNSFYDVATFGQHPLISDSNTNGWWDQDNNTLDEWEDYLDQQLGIEVKGHMTLIDESTLPNLSVEIKASEVSGEDFDASAFDTVKARVDKAASNKLRMISKRRRGDLRVVNLVTTSILRCFTRQKSLIFLAQLRRNTVTKSLEKTVFVRLPMVF